MWEMARAKLRDWYIVVIALLLFGGSTAPRQLWPVWHRHHIIGLVIDSLYLLAASSAF
jgi:hypothetical protein